MYRDRIDSAGRENVDAARLHASKPPAVRRRRCYLVRHGDVVYFNADGQPIDPRSVPLSVAGVQQAQLLADMLRALDFDRVLCSDYPRAQQTAQLLLRGRDIAIEARPALREIRAGRLRDIPSEQVEAEVAYAYERAGQPEAAFMGGEPWLAFERRVLAEFEALLDDPSWDQVLVASHDGVNRILLGWAIGCGLSGVAALEQDTACLNIVDVDMVGGRVIRRLVRVMNLTPYDPDKANIGLTGMEKVFRSFAP